MSELKEFKKAMRVYNVNAKCPKCGGELNKEHNILLTYPPKFRYTCCECGAEFIASESYPFVEYEEIDEDTEIDNKLCIDLPDNPTCGNVIESIFDVSEVEEHNCCIFMKLDRTCDARFSKEWWYSPFIREEK